MIQPVLKWAGGKRWLIQNHRDLFPTHFGRYYEPFLGGASCFFAIRPKRATLSDLNKDLINLYKVIRDKPNFIETRLKRLERTHSSETYYEMRAKRNLNKDERAIQFLYLNRTCFNGLYRENKKGEFNVPVGSKTKVAFPSGYLAKVGETLRGVTLMVSDFEQVIDRSRKNDFVFIDPPYTVSHDLNGFIKYNDTLFTWNDQIRLRDCIERAAKRGVKLLVLNANHKSIRDIYSDFSNKKTLTRHSVLSASPLARGARRELAISI